mmetsp:Transcript_9588/g.13024  ORF Transcript_9588/g.13024 Transcript_9588/m.13024 type:complete len:93 (-) Transcript_9588:85-363(-)
MGREEAKEQSKTALKEKELAACAKKQARKDKEWEKGTDTRRKRRRKNCLREEKLLAPPRPKQANLKSANSAQQNTILRKDAQCKHVCHHSNT